MYLNAQQQYQKDLDQNIDKGDLVRVHSGSKQLDGICRVVERYEEDGVLWLQVKRLIKFNGIIVKASKVTQDVRVQWVTKVTLDSIIEAKMKEIEVWQEHLK